MLFISVIYFFPAALDNKTIDTAILDTANRYNNRILLALI